MIRHRDGIHTPRGGAADKLAGVAERVHRGKTGVRVKLHTLFLSCVLSYGRFFRRLDMARLQLKLLVVAVEFHCAGHEQIHPRLYLVDDAAVVLATKEARYTHRAAPVRHIELQDVCAEALYLTAVYGENAPLHVDAA